MNISNIIIPHGLMLAPMAGVSDHAFRVLCRNHGAEYSVSEMISTKAIHFKDKKTASLALITAEERPMGIQIFGAEPDIMAEAAEIICRDYKPDLLDINMGCPMQKIISNGEGSALMKKPELAADIIRSVVSASNVPVTVKLRSGWDDDHINAVEIAVLAEKCGAAAICIHGRTREQLYRPPCNLDIIRDVKHAVNIPVIGNGGIMCAADAIHMMEYTNCDGIMIARGACGNPWIFDETVAVMYCRSFSPPTFNDIIKTALAHARQIIADKGEYTGICESRKHIAWYIKGKEGAPAARDKINSAAGIDEIESILYNLQKNIITDNNQ